jgi:Raf kinase inhibitor-like YbhB/YbcL family protein
MATAIALAALGLVVAGCGSGDTRSSPSEVPMATELRLTSTAFAAGGAIPATYTCDGEDVSPDLEWEGVPASAGALVLVVDDPDANGFIHWIVYDLTASERGALARAVSESPDAPPQGTNDFGRVGWGGPCPPSGEHRYRFTLSALAAPLELEGAPGGADLRQALAGATVVGSAVLEATYRRGG